MNAEHALTEHVMKALCILAQGLPIDDSDYRMLRSDASTRLHAGWTPAETIHYMRCMEYIAGDTMSEDDAIWRMNTIHKQVTARLGEQR